MSRVFVQLIKRVSDFYLDVEACARRGLLLTTALLELFLHYGFDPPKPEIGDLKHPDKTVSETNRKNLAPTWPSRNHCLA